MPSDQDWINKWSQSKCPAPKFDLRREPYLRYDSYSLVFDDLLDGMRIVCSRVGVLKNSPTPGSFMSSTRQRVWDLLNWLSLQYSAGVSVDVFSEGWPHVMSWMEEYATCNEAFDQSSEADNYMTPHAALRTEDYWIIALRSVCFGLLTGNGRDMPRIMRFLDYCNDDMGVRDGLLERLVAPFVPGRGFPPDTATRHLPYRKLFKVFDASPDKRPALMVKYLDEWYHASRREPYIDQHDDGVRTDFCFYGYWSWEAAAVTWLLDIDDSSYRDMSFYPRDLVDFGRNTPNTLLPPSAPPPQYADTPCQRAGYWTTTAKHGLRRYFEQGEIFPAIPSETTVGQTLWEWDLDQSPVSETVHAEPARVADSADAAPRAGLWLQAGHPSVRCRVAEGEPLPLVDGLSVVWLWTEQPPPGMRATTGQPCPYPGVWCCEDIPIGPRSFMHGVAMPPVQGRNVIWFLVSAS